MMPKDNIRKEKSSTRIKKQSSLFPGFIENDSSSRTKYTLVKDLNINSDYNSPLILDREKQCNNIINKIKQLKDIKNADEFSCLFLTGMSGSGKSVIINRFLIEKLRKTNETVTIINDNYNNGDLIYKEIEEKNSTIVIFDQFEDALNYPRFFETIKNLYYDKKERIVIFSFPQNFFYQINKRINETFISKIEENPNFINPVTYFITNDEHDIDELKTIINRFTQEDFSIIERCLEECRKCTQTSGSYKSILQEEIYSPSLIFLCSILSRIEVGASPLVEFSTLSFIYEQYEFEISANLDIYIDNLDNVIDLYLNKWVERFDHQQTGKIILYLLNDGKNYTIDDIKFTTFEDEKNFEYSESSKCIIDVIDENKFLKAKENYNGFYKGFSAIHDYIGLKINEYCFRNLDNGIRQNVDYYRRTMNTSSETRRPMAFSQEKTRIQKRYLRFNGKTGKYVINFLLAIMCLSSLIITIFFTYHQNQKAYNDLGVYMSIGCFLAIYYYYNFIMQSTRMLTFISYFPMLFAGSVSVPLCYIFPNLFGILMGITLCILGITQFCLGFITIYDAKKTFISTGIVYFFFGVIVIGFGIAYLNEPNWLYHMFFIFYVLGANYGQTKYSYVIERIGKINTFKL